MTTIIFTVTVTFPPQNGLLSAVPYLLAWMIGIIAGETADFLLSRNILSIVIIRKLFTTLGKQQWGIQGPLGHFALICRARLTVVWITPQDSFCLPSSTCACAI